MSGKIGPNVRKLISHKIAKDAIPDGGGVEDGLNFFRDPVRIQDGYRTALAWVQESIKVVRQAAEPNPWKDADDEAIAAEINRLVEETLKQKRDSRCPSTS